MDSVHTQSRAKRILVVFTFLIFSSFLVVFGQEDEKAISEPAEQTSGSEWRASKLAVGREKTMDVKLPYIKFESEVYERLDKYFAENSNEDIESVGKGGPIRRTEVEEDTQKFFLICALRIFEPENGFSYLNLADAFLANELVDEGRKVYLILKQVNYPFMGFYDSPDFHLGWLETDLGNFEQALNHFELCLKEYPEARNSILPYLAMMYHKWGQYEQAVKFYDEHLRNFGKDEVEKMTVRHELDNPQEKALEILREDAAHSRPFRGRLEWPLATCGLEELQETGAGEECRQEGRK